MLLKEDDVDEIQQEILREIKHLSIDQATIKAKLDSYLTNQDRLETSLKDVKKEVNKVSRHEYIIKGMLWVYGVLFSFVLYKFFPSRFD